MEELIAPILLDHLGEPLLETQPVSAHASDRKLLRLLTRHGTYIAIKDSSPEEFCAFTQLTRHFSSYSLPVPRILHSDSVNLVTIVEDLGQKTLLETLLELRGDDERVPEEVVRLYENAITVLPRFQVEAGRSVDFSACFPERKFDKQNMLFDMEFFLTEYVKRLSFEVDEERLRGDFDTLASFLMEAEDHFFMYRDFQARNIVVRNGFSVGFVDYQGGRAGPLQYDVVSLLFQSRAALPETLRAHLLDTYLSACSHYIDLDKELFVVHFEGFVLIRLMQVLGTYAKQGLGAKKQYFIDSLPFALRNVEQVLTSLSLPLELPTLRALLQTVVERGVPR